MTMPLTMLMMMMMMTGRFLELAPFLVRASCMCLCLLVYKKKKKDFINGEKVLHFPILGSEN